MLRKLFSILVLMVYLPAVAGVGFSTHYCMGEASKTKVFSVSKQSCCCGPEQEEKSDCCSDQIKLVKLDKDQQYSDQRLSFKPVAFNLVSFAERFVFSPLVSFTVSTTQQPDPPPLVAAVSKRILHCSFII